MPHPSSGFGLCHARNLGLAAAGGNLIAYLDDDNAIAPEFVEATCRFFDQHPTIMSSMVQQRRRRDKVNGAHLIQSGQTFVAPSVGTTIGDLVLQRELFDSNGFTHRRLTAPLWNPNCRIFADYEYLLRCISRWGRESFELNKAVLVDYVQRSDGIIGQSSYQDWAIDIEQILDNAGDYSALTTLEQQVLRQILCRWQSKRSRRVAAFSR